MTLGIQNTPDPAQSAATDFFAGPRIAAADYGSGDRDASGFALMLDQQRVEQSPPPREVNERQATVTGADRGDPAADSNRGDRSVDAGEHNRSADEPSGRDAATRANQTETPTVTDEPVAVEDESSEVADTVQPVDEAADEQADVTEAEVIPIATQLLTIQNATDRAVAQSAAATTSAVPAATTSAATGGTTQSASSTSAQLGAAGIAIVEPTQAQTQSNAGDTGGQPGDSAKPQTAVKPLALATDASSNAPSASQFSSASAAEAPAATPVAQTSANARAASITALSQGNATAGASNTAPDAANLSRVSRGLSSAIQQRGGAVTLRLTPVDMGTVRIQLQMTGTSVSASFHAESASAHTLLTQQLSSLRQSLEGQGLQVERLSVQSMQAAATSNSQSGSNAGGQSQQDASAQQQSANDGRSRGQYSQQQSNGRQQPEDNPGGQRPRGFNDHLDHHAADAA